MYGVSLMLMLVRTVCHVGKRLEAISSLLQCVDSSSDSPSDSSSDYSSYCSKCYSPSYYLLLLFYFFSVFLNLNLTIFLFYLSTLNRLQ